MRALDLIPRFNSQATPRHSRIANRSTLCPDPEPGAPSIQAGRLTPKLATR